MPTDMQEEEVFLPHQGQGPWRTPNLYRTRARLEDLGVEVRNGKRRYDEIRTIAIYEDDTASRRALEAFAQRFDPGRGAPVTVVSLARPSSLCAWRAATCRDILGKSAEERDVQGARQNRGKPPGRTGARNSARPEQR